MDADELSLLLPWWKVWRKTDRKFLLFPGSISEQPGDIMNGILALDGLFDLVQESLRKNK